jgi:rare lipoprotein A
MNKKLLFIVVLFLVANSVIYSLSLYKNNVVASYYAEDFHGKKTSNGEDFNMNSLTCAHKSLPFNTIIKVTNISNGKSVNVRVNDRGPFVLNREIDLSKAAAVQLDMIGKGTVKVKLEIVKQGENTKKSVQTAQKALQIMKQRFPNYQESVETQTSEQKKTTDLSKISKGTLWDIQLGSFKTRENANKMAQKLLKAGYKNVVFQTTKDYVRVAIKEVQAENVAELLQKLKNDGYEDFVLKQRNNISN